jgi:flagellar biosynthesis protein FliQ
MTEELVLHLGQEAMKTSAMVAAPILISTLVMGLIVSVFQALTQINEATLTFVPKMIVVGLVIIIAGPWMLDILKGFTVEILSNFPAYIQE